MLREQFNFIKKTITFKRAGFAVENYLSYFISLITNDVHISGFPPVVMIEPTNICNLRCPLCPSGNGTLKRPRGYMELNLFKKIIDEIRERSFMVCLWNQGESFLNKDFIKMIKYASEAGLFTLVSTNGNVELDPQEIIDSGLDSMILSLDGATQETYNKYRINGKLDLVLNNVNKMIKARKKGGINKPFLRWQFLVLKHNEHEIDAIKKLAREYEVDHLELKTVQIYSKEDINNFLPLNPKYRRYKIKNDDFELKVGIKNRCRRIWTSPVINWDGEVSICCFDKDLEFPIGNVKNQQLEKIWKNNAINKIRQQILKNRKAIAICRNCGESVKLRIKSRDL